MTGREFTDWLSTDEQRAWRDFLFVSSRTIEELDDRSQRRADLALTDYEILVFLSEADGHQLRMSELADQVLVSRSRLTYRIDRLAGRGLVEREDCVDDKRGTFAKLTPDGLDLLEQAAPGHVEDVQQILFRHLGPGELESFGAVMNRIRTGLE